MASHVGANSHVEFWRRSQPKMGIEAYDGVDAADRHLQTLGHPVQLLDWEIAKLPLDGS